MSLSNSGRCTLDCKEKTQTFQQILQKFLSDAIIVLGDPPCNYCFCYMGAAASEQVTLNPTLRWGFLVEDEQNFKYFEDLAVFLNAQIIALGEFPTKGGVNFTVCDEKKGVYSDPISPKVATPKQLVEASKLTSMSVPLLLLTAFGFTVFFLRANRFKC